MVVELKWVKGEATNKFAKDFGCKPKCPVKYFISSDKAYAMEVGTLNLVSFPANKVNVYVN